MWQPFLKVKSAGCVGWINLAFEHDVKERLMFWLRSDVFDATFNNISVISWRSVLLVEETEGPRENYWPVTNH